jgi:hypothetical protein
MTGVSIMLSSKWICSNPFFVKMKNPKESIVSIGYAVAVTVEMIGAVSLDGLNDLSTPQRPPIL